MYDKWLNRVKKQIASEIERSRIWIPFKYKPYVRTVNDKYLMCRFRHNNVCRIKKKRLDGMVVVNCRSCRLWEHR
jgi:hypothetical protein